MQSATMRVGLKPETAEVVRANAKVGCFLCKRILQTMGKGNELKDWPGSGDMGEDRVEFPVSGQRNHILLLLESGKKGD